MLSEEGRVAVVVVSGCVEKKEGRVPKKLLNSPALPVGLNDARAAELKRRFVYAVFSQIPLNQNRAKVQRRPR